MASSRTASSTLAGSPSLLLDEAVARIQQLSSAVWEVRAAHEPVQGGTWRRRWVCPACRVPFPCRTWRLLHDHRVAGC
jgi:hypothetical protein